MVELALPSLSSGTHGNVSYKTCARPVFDSRLVHLLKFCLVSCLHSYFGVGEDELVFWRAVEEWVVNGDEVRREYLGGIWGG